MNLMSIVSNDYFMNWVKQITDRYRLICSSYHFVEREDKKNSSCLQNLFRAIEFYALKMGMPYTETKYGFKYYIVYKEQFYAIGCIVDERVDYYVKKVIDNTEVTNAILFDDLMDAALESENNYLLRRFMNKKEVV